MNGKILIRGGSAAEGMIEKHREPFQWLNSAARRLRALPLRAIGIFAFFIIAPCFAETTETIPLAQGLEAAWLGKVYSDDAPPEIIHYAARKITGGRWRTYPLEMRTSRVRLNRERYTEADWPYGDRPLCPAIRLSWRVSEEFSGGGGAASPISSSPGPVHRFAALYFDAESPERALKFTLSRQDFRGALFKQFDLWRNPPEMIIHSWRDSEGDAEKFPSWDARDVLFEEQLLLLTRALRHRAGVRYSFRILESQETDRAPLPNPVDAEIVPVFDSSPPPGVAPGAAPAPAPDRLFLLQKPGGFTALYRIAPEFPNHLLEWKTSDGRALEIVPAQSALPAQSAPAAAIRPEKVLK